MGFDVPVYWVVLVIEGVIGVRVLYLRGRGSLCRPNLRLDVSRCCITRQWARVIPMVLTGGGGKSEAIGAACVRYNAEDLVAFLILYLY